MTGYCQLRIIHTSGLTACLPHPLITAPDQLQGTQESKLPIKFKTHAALFQGALHGGACLFLGRPSLLPSPTAPGGQRSPCRCPLHRHPANRPEATSSQAALFSLLLLSSRRIRGGRGSLCPRAEFSTLFKALHWMGVNQGEGVSDKHTRPARPGRLDSRRGSSPQGRRELRERGPACVFSWQRLLCAPDVRSHRV